MRNSIDIEIDYIILSSIAKFGYKALPKNYSFLNRYAFKGMYIEMVSRNMEGLSIAYLDAAIRKEARDALASVDNNDLSELLLLKERDGSQTIKTLLDNNPYCWKTFLCEMRKIKK